MSIHKNSDNKNIPKIEFSNFDDSYNPNHGWILLLYGSSGAGKTWFAGTADHSLYINTGGGIETLRSPLFKYKYPNIQRKIVDVYETFDNGRIKKAVGLDRVTDTIDQFLLDSELRSWVKTIVLDDATSLRTFAKLRGIEINDEIAGRTGDSKRKLNRFVNQEVLDTFREMSIIEWFCMQYIPIFRSEGINFLMIAHDRAIYGKSSKSMDDRPLRAVKPGFIGQTFPDEVPKHFDEVWYIQKKYSEKGGEYSQIRTGGSGIELTKSRTAGVFQRYIINKSFEQLLQQRREGKIHPEYTRSLTTEGEQ